MLEYLKATEVIVGLMVLLFTSLLGLFAWWDKRSRRYVDLKATNFTNSNTEVARRLKAVENDLRRIDRDVGSMRERLDALPTAKDFAGMQAAIASVSATLTQLNGLTQTLYKAAMRASPERDE